MKWENQFLFLLPESDVRLGLDFPKTFTDALTSESLWHNPLFKAQKPFQARLNVWAPNKTFPQHVHSCGSSSVFTCSDTNCIVKKQELIVSLPHPIVSTVATNTLPLIYSTTTIPFNQNNKIEAHFSSSGIKNKIMSLIPYVHLCCRCRVMHTQDTDFLYFLALSMLPSWTSCLCGMCVICPGAKNWADTSTVALKSNSKLVFLSLFAGSHFSWTVRKKKSELVLLLQKLPLPLGVLDLAWLLQTLIIVFVCFSITSTPFKQWSPVFHKISYPSSLLNKCQKKNLLPYICSNLHCAIQGSRTFAWIYEITVTALEFFQCLW